VIKNHVSCRVCASFRDKPQSEFILGNSDACYLPPIKGRLIYKDCDTNPTEFQAYYFDSYKGFEGLEHSPGKLLTDSEKADSFGKK
jgi:hypothetical protein